MTIPSSTKIPITMIIPNNESTLIVTPSEPAKINMPKNEIGIPKATQKASLGLRKSAKNSSTKTIPCPPFFSNNLVLSTIVIDESLVMSIRTLECVSLNCSMYSLVKSATVIRSSEFVVLT